MIGTKRLAARPPPNSISGAPGLGRNWATAKRRPTADRAMAADTISGGPNPCIATPRQREPDPGLEVGHAGVALDRAHGRDRQVEIEGARRQVLRHPQLRLAAEDLSREAQEGDARRKEAGAAPGEELLVLAGENVDDG